MVGRMASIHHYLYPILPGSELCSWMASEETQYFPYWRMGIGSFVINHPYSTWNHLKQFGVITYVVTLFFIPPHFA
jgi:hypothetical protein